MTEPAKESDRGTGKTFRKILEALYYFSEGKQIIFVCPTIEAAQYSYTKALDIANVFDLPITDHNGGLKLKLGTAILKFLTKHVSTDGMPDSIIVIKDL